VSVSVSPTRPPAATSDRRFDPEVLRQLGRLDLIASALADGLDLGLHRSRRRGFSTEFSDHRPYAPGDDPRTLDWRVLARTDRLFVKRFAAETELEVTLVLDGSRSCHWRYQERLSKFEYAGTLAAALARAHLRQHDRVGLLLAGPDGPRYLAPSSRNARFSDILAELARASEGGAAAFTELLGGLAGLRRHRGELHLWSDAEEDPTALTAALQRLTGHRDAVVFFHLLDQAEEELPEAKVTHLRDSETGELVAVDYPAWCRRHATRVAEFRAHWRAQCARLGLLYVPLHTGLDYREAVGRYLTARAAW